MRALHAVTHAIGVALGFGLYPLTAAFVLRHRFQRAFHPDGLVYVGRFEALVPEGQALAGPAIARLSATLTRAEAEEPDVIGLVVRFGASESSPCPSDAQDSLAATFEGFAPAQVKQAFRTTNVHDFLDNDYRAVSLYRLPGIGPARLRWSGVRRPAGPGGRGTRMARLDEAVAADDARFVLEASQGVDAWLALGILHLERRIDLPQRPLAFSPFRDGRGIAATGFLNGLRRPSYVLSQLLRGTWMR